MSRRGLGLGLLTLVALAAGLGALATPRTAAAHPLGNFTTNRYARIELYRDGILLHYVLDMAEIPTQQILPSIDRNGDGLLDSGEQRAFLARARSTYAQGFTLSLDGRRLDLETVESAVELLDGQAGLKVLRIALVYRAATPTGGEVAIAFEDRNFEGRAGWKEIVVRPSEGTIATVDAKLLADQSDALRSYPEATLRSSPDVSRVAFRWQAGTGAEAPGEVAIAKGAGRKDSGFSALLRRRQSIGVVLLSLVAAFAFGMLHALGPGHGKTVVAAYLVGSRGTARHALALGFTVTATHTAAVYLLGFITLVAAGLIAPERLYVYLGVASGLIILLMGVALAIGRAGQLRKTAAGAGEHRHGPFGRAHSHLPAQPEAEIAGAPALALSAAFARPTHAPHDHDHPQLPAREAHPETRPPGSPGWRSLVGLGIAGGMIPCPSAIIVMLAAISIGQVLYGMLLIVAFSLGLAGVLTAIGVVLVAGKRLSERSHVRHALARPAVARSLRFIPILSAAAITAAGAMLTYQAWDRV